MIGLWVAAVLSAVAISRTFHFGLRSPKCGTPSLPHAIYNRAAILEMNFLYWLVCAMTSVFDAIFLQFDLGYIGECLQSILV